MHPDPKKVQGITEMTAPMDKQQLQSFLGMVNYMGTFIPNLSHHTEPLRAMLKKDNVFHWEEQQTQSFQKIKALIAKANKTPLRYYDRTKPVKVQVDASLRGLGACLIQEYKGEDQPIAFASKSLTDMETRYTNIERELLAIVFAFQWFSTYLLGRSFIAESDHKPLEMIAMKNLAQHATPSTEDVAGASEIRRHHQVQTRTTDATGRRFKPLPSKSLTGDQIGYASRLHCLHKVMD